MKKFLGVLIALCISVMSIFAYQAQIIEGEKNIKEVLKSKPINFIITTENTLLWKKPLTNWIKMKNSEGDDITFEEMESEMLTVFDRWIGPYKRKWGSKLLNNKSEAKKGYLMVINVDQVIPAPMAGVTAHYTITVYQAGSNKSLFKVKLKISQINTPSIPRKSLFAAGEMLVDELIGFMRKGK